MKLINVVACEFCGHSEKYGEDPGQDSYHDVRARICRHEQRCEKNPLVKTIKDIRKLLESADEVPFHDEKSLSDEDMAAAIRLTYDCFFDIKKTCDHKNTYTDRIEPTATNIEVCKDCGMSRSTWEQGSSGWQMIDIEAEKKRCPECFGDPEGKKTCGYCNPKPIKAVPEKRRPPEPKPARPTTKRIVVTAASNIAAAQVKPGPITSGSSIAVVPRKIPGSRNLTSVYYGVARIKKTGRWLGQIKRKGLRFRQMFAIEESAAIAVQEKLGNKAEADRIRKILTEKQAAAAVGFVQVPAGGIGITVASKDQPGRIKVVFGDKKQEADAADELDKIKGDVTWQWECKGCGNEVNPATSGHCHKCGGSSFEKIPVLSNPQAFLDRPEGRHSNPTKAEKRNAKKAASPMAAQN